MLSTTMAKNYGPPLTGYPGTSDNKTSEQMIDGIISTLSAKYHDPRPFIHIKVNCRTKLVISILRIFYAITILHA